MNRRIAIVLSGCLAFSSLVAAQSTQPTTLPGPTVKWQNILTQKESWYTSADAARVAENVLRWQKDCGGWNKNIEMAKFLTEEKKAEILAEKPNNEATIDNDATSSQIRFLAKMYAFNKKDDYRKATEAGIEYLLKAQYQDSGGWPQYFPLRGGYHDQITYNDNAMLRVLMLMEDIRDREGDFAFLSDATVSRADAALNKGIDCILKTQIVSNGRKSGWCAQHDHKTLQPAKARSYELPSISGAESVGLVKFLMKIDKPSPEVIDAIESAVAWFKKVKVEGKRIVETDGDRRLVEDPNARPLWGRFYEIGTDRPIFSNRDGVIRYDFNELGADRRNGYAWLRPWGSDLIEKDYPAWKKRVGRE